MFQNLTVDTLHVDYLCFRFHRTFIFGIVLIVVIEAARILNQGKWTYDCIAAAWNCEDERWRCMECESRAVAPAYLEEQYKLKKYCVYSDINGDCGFVVTIVTVGFICIVPGKNQRHWREAISLQFASMQLQKVSSLRIWSSRLKL